MVIWPNSTGMVPGWSPTYIVQMVLIGCICRSRHNAQSFHIWYITSSRGPLPKLFKLCHWGQNWPRPWCHNFTLIYIMKTSNDIFSLTANGNLTKLYSNNPWVVPYQNCSNRSSWLHKKVTGSINRFLKWNFQKSSCLKLQGPELLYLVYSII